MDAAVGGIDLRKGCWIHCKWCNTTLKTTPFSLTSWKIHERRKTHVANGQIAADGCSQPHIVTSSSQSSAHGSPTSFLGTPKTPLSIQSSSDYNTLMLVKRDLHQNKQQQARYERDVTNVINAMTSLVSDQQSDMDSLRCLVQNMRREIEGLKSQVAFLRQKRKQNAQPPRKSASRTEFYDFQQSLRNNEFSVRCQDLQRCNKVSKTMRVKTKASMTDMDLFEKRFRLM